MNFILITIHAISYIAYWALEGIREGYYYDRIPMENIYSGDDRLILKKQRSIKTEFVLQRTSFLVASFISGFLIVDDYFYLIGLLLMQPFIHLGFYYKTRNQLNPSIYLDKFFCNASSTSTAFIDTKSSNFIKKNFSMKTYLQLTKTPVIRIVLFMLGAFFLLISLL